MSNHTPKPWIAKPNASGGDEAFTIEVDVPDGLVVAFILKIDPILDPEEEGEDALQGYSNGPTTHANARLIATAPDLLEAARTALHALAMYRQTGIPPFNALLQAYEKLEAAITKAEASK